MKETTMYAGDLTKEQIGRRIRVVVSATMTIEDELKQVSHTAVRTTVWFKSTPFTNGLMSPDHGATLPHTTLVAVL